MAALRKDHEMNDPSHSDQGSNFMQEVSNVESRTTRSSRFWLPEPTRAWRRRAVLAAYGGYALTVAIYLVGFFALCSRSLGAWSIAHDSDSSLDEHQQRVRDRAYRPSYWVVALILLLGTAYIQLADSSGWWLPSSTEASQGITWTLIFLAMTLPTAIIAWTEPDVPAE
jgi:hypothetical protein